MEREPRESQRGCESAAGFPGFVVMTTKPPLPDQTEIRATTDGNAYTNAHEREWEGGKMQKEGKSWEYGRADGERDGAARERKEIPSPSENYPRARGSSNRAVPSNRSATPAVWPSVVCCTENAGPVTLNPTGKRTDVSSASTPYRRSLLHPCQ